MSITIVDVAREAAVSKSTVSLVINGNKAIKAETRKRVLMKIEELGYVPNINARSLTTKKTHILGVIMPVENFDYSSYEFDSENEIFSYDVSVGIPAGLANSDYGILTERFCSSGSRNFLPNLVCNKRVDGVFITGGSFKKSLLVNLKKRKIPCVVVGRYTSELDSVSPDFVKAAYISTEYLINTDHKKILFINCPVIFPSNQDRLEGIRDAAAKYGFVLDSRWIINVQHNTGESGYQAIKYCWEQGLRPDAVFSANDYFALGVMRFLYEQKVRVPEDISVIGYEDSILAGYAVPPLTTISIAKAKMGEEAARLMLDRIKNPKKRYVSLKIKPVLVERATVLRRN